MGAHISTISGLAAAQSRHAPRRAVSVRPAKIRAGRGAPRRRGSRLASPAERSAMAPRQQGQPWGLPTCAARRCCKGAAKEKRTAAIKARCCKGAAL